MPPRIRRFAAAALLAAIALAAYETRIRTNMVDFGVYRKAGARALAGERLYRPEDGHYIFKYLPAFAFAVVPFAAVDEDAAKALWFALSVIALIAFVRWSVRALPNRRRSTAVVTCLTVVFMAKFYLRELTLGQANILLGVVLIGVPLAIERRAAIAAGVLAGVAVFIKPYAVLLLPWLVVAGGVPAAAAAAATMAAGLLAPALRYGWTANGRMLADWYRTVTDTTAPNLLAADNISVAAMWGKWLGIGRAATMLAAASGGILLVTAIVVIAWRRRARAPVYLEAALLMSLIPLLSPQGWDYVLLLATPAVACLLDRIDEVDAPWRWAILLALALLGLTIFDVMGRRLYGAFMMLSIESVCALLLVAALAQLRRRGLA